VPRPLKVCLLACLVLGAPLGVASPAQRARDPWSTDAIRSLVVRGDARSLAAAAMLLQTAGPPAGLDGLHAIDLAERAMQAMPDNRAIGWIHFRICELTPGCDVPGAATTLRWVDADNAAPWLSTLAAAVREHDELAEDRALSGMSETRRFALYSNATMILVFDAYKAVGITGPRGAPKSDHERLALATSLTDAVATPAFRPLTDACKDTQGRMRRRDLCIRAAALMQHADSVSAQLEGFSMQKRLSAPDSKEVRTAGERQRNLESKRAGARRFETAFLPWFNNRLALHRLALMRQFAREEDVLNAILREHHVDGEASHD
jgi:hypothetical protein